MHGSNVIGSRGRARVSRRGWTLDARRWTLETHLLASQIRRARPSRFLSSVQRLASRVPTQSCNVPGLLCVTSSSTCARRSLLVSINVMPVRPLRLRLLALAVALVQLLGPAASSLADAKLEAGSLAPQAASHIESHRRPECARVHPDDCALCQYLSAGGSEPAAPAIPAPAIAAGAPAPAAADTPAPTWVDGLPRTRAPPAFASPDA
jgi:hypothetical protein